MRGRAQKHAEAPSWMFPTSRLEPVVGFLMHWCLSSKAAVCQHQELLPGAWTQSGFDAMATGDWDRGTKPKLPACARNSARLTQKGL